MKNRRHPLLLFFFAAVSIQPVAAQQTNETERLQLAKQMETSVQTELLNKWYPQCYDTLFGGFLSTFTYDFKPTGPQDKFIVTQARHVWTTSKASALYPEKSYYLYGAKHGFQFLRDVMWDKTYGGFYNLVDRQGHNKSNPKVPKDAYGNAFAIYALAAYYKASGDTAALHLAQKAFLWMEAHSHDAVYGGYYMHLKMDGTPVVRDATVPSASDIGYKDQNSSIHLLEALTELYQVWPDDLVRKRLQEMLFLIRDKLVTRQGYLVLFFEPNWTPVSFRDSSEAYILQHRNLDYVSFGHNIETTYLMLEASYALGLQHDTLTAIVGKRMVDHALKNGWDNGIGGFYDDGYYFKGGDTITITQRGKNWWAQAEGMNTLLLMADRYPMDTMQYYGKFKKQWHYIKTYLIDHEYGDWYAEGIDHSPQAKTGLKGHIWKGTYHNFRAMQNCIKRLRGTKEIDKE